MDDLKELKLRKSRKMKEFAVAQRERSMHSEQGNRLELIRTQTRADDIATELAEVVMQIGSLSGSSTKFLAERGSALRLPSGQAKKAASEEAAELGLEILPYN
jgi:hypothetical protein